MWCAPWAVLTPTISTTLFRSCWHTRASVKWRHLVASWWKGGGVRGTKMLWLYFRSSAPHSITSHLNISSLEPTRVNSARERGASHGLEMSRGTDDERQRPALTPWETQAAFYGVHFLQGKLSPWQGPWTSLGLLRTSGSLPPLSCTTWRSAHRWTTWVVCTTLSVPLWE